jgi:hypothetical protein
MTDPWTMASLMALVSGITACGIVFTGYMTSIGLFARAHREQVRFIVWEALILLCLGTFYLGTVTTFFSLIFTGYNLYPDYMGAQLCYTIAPFGSAICMYAGFTMLGKEKLAKPMAIIQLLTGIIYWFGLYFQPDITIHAALPIEEGGGLFDYELLSYVQGLTALYLVLLLVILGGGFFWFAKQSTGDVRKRSLFIAIGCCFFTVSGAVDSLINLEYLIIIPRLFMITGAILLYKGFLSGVSEVKAKEKSRVAAETEALPKLSTTFRRKRTTVQPKGGAVQQTPAASRSLSGLPERPQTVIEPVTTWIPPAEMVVDTSQQAGGASQTVFEMPTAPEPAKINSTPPAPTASTKACPSCGNTLPAAAKFCNVCGTRC